MCYYKIVIIKNLYLQVMKEQPRLQTISDRGINLENEKYLIPLTKTQVAKYIYDLRMGDQLNYVVALVGVSHKKFENILGTVIGADIIEYIIECDNHLPLTEIQIDDYVKELKKTCDFKDLLKYMETNESGFREMFKTVRGYNYAVRLITNYGERKF